MAKNVKIYNKYFITSLLQKGYKNITTTIDILFKI